MKKKIADPLPFIFALFIFSCKQDSPITNTVSNNTVAIVSDTNTKPSSASNMKLWAEQVESSINLSVPDDWSPEDWNNIFRNIDHKAIYADIIDAVVSGKQKAYNFFTDATFTPDQIKAILNKKVTVINKEAVINNAENKISHENIGPNTISLIRVREKIYFDKDNFKLERKPTTLILYVNHYSEDGTFIGYQPLFYVRLNN